MEIATLEEYTNIAGKIVTTYLRKSNYNSYIDYNEIVGEIVTVLVKSDISYNSSFNITIYQYRKKNCYRHLNKYLKRQTQYYKKIRNYINDLVINNHTRYYKKPQEDRFLYLQFLIQNSNLTPLQQEHVELYLQGLNGIEISEKMGTSRKNVYEILDKACKKMRMLIK